MIYDYWVWNEYKTPWKDSVREQSPVINDPRPYETIMQRKDEAIGDSTILEREEKWGIQSVHEPQWIKTPIRSTGI